MPNCDVHGRVGAVVGGSYAAYRAWGQPGPHILTETAGGVLGGTIGGLLPDWIDAPTSPRHRAQAHSMAITGTLGYHMNEQIYSWQTWLRSQAKRVRTDSCRRCLLWSSFGMRSWNFSAALVPARSPEFWVVMALIWC
jgi:hypothetical protein